MKLEEATPTQLFRDQNKVVDLLAREEKKSQDFYVTVILWVPPVFVLLALDADMLGTFFIRLVNISVLNQPGWDVVGNSIFDP